MTEINLEKLTTEETSHYDNLDKMSVSEILKGINQEDRTVPDAVEKAIPQIEALVNQIVPRMKEGGRLFYIGAGTSGRLGVVDASECPPTFGVPFEMVVGLIAGGDGAIRKAVENAEDDIEQAWHDLLVYDVNELDIIIGIAASGRTPYVIGGLRKARENGLLTGSISCNQNSEISHEAEYSIEAIPGPEFVTGSTRMKAGTAQKLILNMISTSVMIQLGRVRGNRMVDMQLSNKKLIVRAENMVMKELGIEREEAEALLEQNGSVRQSIDIYRAKH